MDQRSEMKQCRFTYSDLRACLILALLVVAFATREPILLTAYAVASLVLILANIPAFSTIASREVIAVTALAVAILLAFPVTLIRNANVAFHILAVSISLGVAYVLTRNVEAYVRASWIILVTSQAYVVVYLAQTGLDNFPLENILPESSSNGVTSYLIVLQANACAGVYLLRRQASVVTSLITLGICIVGYGRGSLLAAAALVAINALFAFGNRSQATAMVGALVTVALTACAYLIYSEEIDAFVQVNTKIGSGLEDKPRSEIMTDYMRKLDNAGPMLFGADYKGTSIDNSYFGNPHNSYIRAHNIFGLPYLLCILLWPLILDRRGWPLGSRIFVYTMIVVVLIRAFTEPLLFPTLFDFFYFALCFALARTPTELSTTDTRSGSNYASN